MTLFATELATPTVTDERMLRTPKDVNPLWACAGHQRKLEEEVERKRRHLREQMAIIKDKASDINKANELITKLQNDNIAFHTEVRLCTRLLTLFGAPCAKPACIAIAAGVRVFCR